MSALILYTVTEILADICVLNQEDIHPSSKIAEDLGADSLDLTEAILHIESEFQIHFTDEEQESLKTVADIVALIESKSLPTIHS